MFLLDSDILIDVGRGYPPAQQWLSVLPELPSVPSIVCMELVAGCGNKTQLRQVQKLLSLYPVVGLREQDCLRALADFTHFYLSHNLGLTDALIAATAVGQGATLVTFNTKHFAVVPNLTTEQPYERS